MSDALLRDLERRLAADASDGATRVALASALTRAGRRRDALRTLDLSRVRDPLFSEAKKLADALWREELGGLSTRWTTTPPIVGIRTAVTIDRVGTLVALRASRADLPDHFVVHDLSTGTRLHDGPALGRHKLFSIANGFVRPEGQIVVTYQRTERALEIARRPLPAGTATFEGIAPDGRRVWTNGPGGSALHAWPSGELVARGPPRFALAVDWESNVWIDGFPGALAVHDLAGGELRVFDSRVGLPLATLGGVVASYGRGLSFHALRGRWSTTLIDDTVEVPAFSLASDRRGVRVLVGDGFARFDLDLETGRVLSSPELRNADGREALFHPHADVVALRKKKCWRLHGLDGRVILELEGAPLAWSPDGFTLVTTTGDRVEVLG